MEYSELNNETFVALPERLETDTNAALVGVTQGNLGIQIGAASLQQMLQLNGAAVRVTQVNF
jgi:hypothetical protein